jgi:EAL domain-containing protein (putative c-di-GMP-specific phosphodiesterase class I)
MSPNDTHSACVLVVDDDDLFLRVCTTVLRRAGLTVEGVSSAREALARVKTNRYDAIVSDIRMPEADGIALLKAARAFDAKVPVLLMTGAPTVESAVSAVEFGAARYLQKPFDIDEFASAVTEAVAGRTGADVPRLNRQLDDALKAVWMAYQPIVKWSTRSILSYEALLRCSHPDIKGPMEMLDLAERTGRVHGLGQVVRRNVANDLVRGPDDTLFFVNLHPADLEDPSLYDPGSPLAAWAPRVVLEVTERASLAHDAALPAHIARLRAMGYRVAVDDLGAGYAGLTTFARIEPDFVKLDASLVRGVDASSTQRRVIRSVLSLAREMGVQVVAEAIETAAERDTIAELGIDLMQGFYFARPQRPFCTVDEKLWAPTEAAA